MKRKKITPQFLTQKVHKEISLTKGLGFTIAQVSSVQSKVKVLLKPNLNHKMTAFGGSAHSAALVGGWALLNFYLPQKNISPDNLVGQDSSIQFLLPIDKNFEVKSFWSSSEDKNNFIKSLQTHRRGRVTLISKVFVGKRLCAIAESRFVVKA